MAKAKRLPSGSYRVQYKIDNHVYSVTRDTAHEAELAALEHQLNLKRKSSPGNLTVGEAIDRYIEGKSNILSPSTVRGYKMMRKTAYTLIENTTLSKLKERDVQLQINHNAATYSAKSISNHYGLLVVALKPYNISFSSIALKPKEKIAYSIPSPDEVLQIINAIEGTNIECWILCAIMLGLRQSEIAGLKWENYTGKQISIKGSIVLGENNEFIEKRTNKSAASTRTLDVPDYLSSKLNNLPRTSAHIFTDNQNTVYSRFKRLLAVKGIRHFKVHDLRHSNASIMLLLGTPDKYAMERMGHSTDVMLKNVYQHTFQSEQDLISEKINKYFNNLINPPKD